MLRSNVITAPEPLDALNMSPELPTLFLGGSIDQNLASGNTGQGFA